MVFRDVNVWFKGGRVMRKKILSFVLALMVCFGLVLRCIFTGIYATQY